MRHGVGAVYEDDHSRAANFCAEIKVMGSFDGHVQAGDVVSHISSCSPLTQAPKAAPGGGPTWNGYD